MQLRRGLEPLVGKLLDSAKVVIVEGGRGVGKTTLARHVARERGFSTTFDLSDPADRDALARDPHRILASSPTPILVDEAQLEPELTVAIKRVVDTSPATGQVLLTGSSRIGRGALGGGDPLAGRAVRVRLNSFTQAELAGEPRNVLDEWWRAEPATKVFPELGLTDLHRRMMTGGLPAVAIDATPADSQNTDIRRRVLSAYVEGVLTANLAGTRTNRSRLLHTFRYLAANPGQILNLSRAASELSMRVETVQGYLDLCTTSFLLDVAPAHRPSQHQALTAHPRVFAADSALAAWAADTSPERLLRDPKLSGALLENFVASELGAQTEWMSQAPRTLHWRDTRASREVDLVFRRPDGDMLAIEVKSAASVSMDDARGLEAFAEAAGDRLVRSIIVYTGRTNQQLDDQIWAVPVSALFGNPSGS